MTRSTMNKAITADTNEALVFRLTENENSQTVFEILAPIGDRQLQPLEQYLLSKPYDEYSEALKQHPAVLLTELAEQAPELFEYEPPPPIIAGRATIECDGEQIYELEHWTNGANSGIQLRKITGSEQDTPLLLAGTPQTSTRDNLPVAEWMSEVPSPAIPIFNEDATAEKFEMLRQDFYKDGLEGILPTEHAWLHEDNQGPGQLRLPDTRGQYDRATNSYYQVAIDEPEYVTLERTGVNPLTGDLETQSLPLLESDSDTEKRAVQRWLTNDLKNNPSETVQIAYGLHQFSFGEATGEAIDPQDYMNQHARRDQAHTQLQDAPEGISAHNYSQADGRYQITAFEDEQGSTPVLVRRAYNALEVQPLSEPVSADAAETLVAQFTETLHGPHGARGVLDQRTFDSTIPIPLGSYHDVPLPLDYPEEPDWRSVSTSDFLRGVHTENDQLAIETFSYHRHPDGSPNVHEQIIGDWNELGDLPQALQTADHTELPSVLSQTRAIHTQTSDEPFIAERYLAHNPIASNPPPIIAAVDSRGIQYTIDAADSTGDSTYDDFYTELRSYDPATEITYVNQLDFDPHPNKTAAYQKALFAPNGGPAAVIALAHPGQSIDNNKWPNEAITEHLPIDDNNHWISDDEGRSWKTVKTDWAQDGQPGHSIQLHQTKTDGDGVPVVVSHEIERVLTKQEAQERTHQLNEQLTKQPEPTLSDNSTQEMEL